MYVDGFMIFMLLTFKSFFFISLYAAVFIASHVWVVSILWPLLTSSDHFHFWSVSSRFGLLQQVSKFLTCVKLRHLQRNFSLIVLVSCPHLLLICLCFYMFRPSLDSPSTYGTQVLLEDIWPLLTRVFPLDCAVVASPSPLWFLFRSLSTSTSGSPTDM